ncbi:thioesterase II family protein [Kitasatospora sp. NPDC058170]|uniref:thioesterase II family protein n=1 Tax=Kitasatospora sp. NPDC058170 TaxID=3346364 RepID=UPI0036D8DF5B
MSPTASPGTAGRAGASADTDRWIRRFRPRPEAAVRLVCFPHAGGSAGTYRPWAEAVDPSVEILAVQYPGRQDRYREPGVENIGELADLVMPALRSAVAGGRFALFGHSLGAALAFEVARRLTGGESPDLLVVSGRRAPSLIRQEAYHRLDDAGLAEHLEHLSGTDRRLLADPEALEMILPAIRSDLRAIETYRSAPGAAVDVPVLALTGDHDPWTTLLEAAGWSAHTTRGFDLRVFHGEHFYLAEHQAEVLQLLARRLSPVSELR